MFWIIVGIITFLVFIAALAIVFVRDRRRERASVVETMSKDLWDEIADERELALARAKKFKEALKKAGCSVK